ncbi:MULTISPECIES: hypothetical protein [unclassified Herbaspirillum]|uniref:hypothetical protein n=1 Tax=unclassified Herbaspirillum TaxID=2624150 RepID=UPI0011504D7C|nr:MULTISPECIES: hypothetical protein [unclassified Herbaspirillum]MBB5391374.1 hypothetical protein [Herbaspirillum sp. SJZ102]TQK12939.1 hypothetical protein FB599_0346 [Herbaspirillum sp. SJZ130]TQK14943.1 hypothetical protein FB598_0284 [Herbaspirillum sp. SJZ106]TWC67298.1 hypothetical protein FB597_104108 [Herbaspirillum sp. SJZ099]
MSMNISFNGGPSGVPTNNDTPSQSQIDGFKKGLEGKSNEDLMKGLLDPKTPQWQKDAILQEMLNKGAKSDEASGAGPEAGDEREKLLKKLMDGTISDEELKKLAGLMGMKPEDLKAIQGALQGQSVGQQDADISGG